MTCEDCGVETTLGLCDGCAVTRVNEARVAAAKNAKFLTAWALKNTHGPGEALLSLMTAFMLIQVTSAEEIKSPIAIWVARASEVLSTMAAEEKG
jgi:hypothetical protein